MIVKFKKLSPFAKVPTYGTDYAACFDIYACEDRLIRANNQATIKTGIAVEIPEGYALLIYGRSGHAFKNRVSLGNCVGVIDSDYRGEICVCLRNDGWQFFEVMRGDRIAQGMVVPTWKVSFIEDELSETERGDNGFGSTGQ